MCEPLVQQCNRRDGHRPEGTAGAAGAKRVGRLDLFFFGLKGVLVVVRVVHRGVLAACELVRRREQM